MKQEYFQKITMAVLLGFLIIISFLMLRPILLSIIFGALLAFIFSPVYDWLHKKIKWRNVSLILLCALIILILVIPLWFLTPPILNQAVQIYQGVQQIDFITPLTNILPQSISSSFSTQVGSALDSFVTRTASNLINSLGNFVLEIPIILLHLVVVFFTFFFTLRDKDKIFQYLKSLMPFPKEVGKDLIESTKGITSSILYGQILVGFVQGICLGAGLFIFGIPNALIFTLLAILMGVIPIIGTGLIWLPLAVYLLIDGSAFSAIGIIFFGILSSSIDNILRPLIVSKRTNISPSIILVGMVGGLFFFGLLGLILGPLILSYLLIVLETYRNKSIPGFIIKPGEDKKSTKAII